MIKEAPKSELILFLKSISYFQTLSTASLTELARVFVATPIQSGDTLMRQGEPGDSLYVVQTGRLLIIKNPQTALENILGEVGRGGLVGELALFTQQPRAATVIAIRDSLLWRLSKEDFDHFAEKNAAHIMPMVRTAILRLLEPHELKSQTVRSLTIAPAGRHPLDADFIYLFVEHLKLLAPTLHINSASIKQKFSDLTTSPAKMELSDPRISEWLNEQEQNYSYVVYETETSDSEWTRLCLRQADKIILVGKAVDKPQLGAIEAYLFTSLDKFFRASIQLVLLHEMDTTLPVHTVSWLKERVIKKVHHIKKGQPSDLKRLIRLLFGQGVALVLGGGGAKSLAHIGVYKALCELNIPVDCVGGTSMGSVIAAAIAMDLSPEKIIDVVEKQIIKNKKFNDYTIPVVSLLGGGGWLAAMKSIFASDLYIEDLWRSFFCIASNFTLRKVEILDRGLLYKAVRASASLPGVVPPISNESNELLIDGGIFNNLPVDVMRSMAAPCEIIAVRVSPFSNIHADIPDGVVSGFKRYISRFGNESLKKISTVPGLSEIIAGAITLCNDEKEQMQLASANHALDINLSQFGILEFVKLPQLIEAGYSATMEHFNTTSINRANY